MSAPPAPAPAPLPRARLSALLPPLVEDKALVVLVAATRDLTWAARAAWDVARAAARGGRRVALVDLWIDRPRLHEPVHLAPTDGIADAFEFGVSLTKAAHEIDGVFFIAAGSHSADPAALIAHPRWQKLHAGFRSEGALLLLYAPAEALALLGTPPDGVITLAREGAAVPALPHGIATVIDPIAPVARPAIVPMRRWTARQGIIAGSVVIAAAAGTTLLARSAERPARALEVVPGPAHARDSLPWVVRLAAYGASANAVADANRLAAAGVTPFVTPIAGPNGAVWYRVLIGPYPSRDSATAARAAVWGRALAPQGQGDVLRAPLSLALDGGARGLTLPAVRWPDGRLLVGAFESPDQAAAAAALLAHAGVRATLVTRTGTTP